MHQQFSKDCARFGRNPFFAARELLTTGEVVLGREVLRVAAACKAGQKFAGFSRYENLDRERLHKDHRDIRWSQAPYGYYVSRVEWRDGECKDRLFNYLGEEIR